MTAATFIGGPLDGTRCVRKHPGRWAIYRDHTGTPIPAARGDRLIGTGARTPAGAVYAFDGTNYRWHEPARRTPDARRNTR